MSDGAISRLHWEWDFHTTFPLGWGMKAEEDGQLAERLQCSSVAVLQRPYKFPSICYRNENEDKSIQLFFFFSIHCQYFSINRLHQENRNRNRNRNVNLFVISFFAFFLKTKIMMCILIVCCVARKLLQRIIAYYALLLEMWGSKQRKKEKEKSDMASPSSLYIFLSFCVAHSTVDEKCIQLSTSEIWNQ